MFTCKQPLLNTIIKIELLFTLFFLRLRGTRGLSKDLINLFRNLILLRQKTRVNCLEWSKRKKRLFMKQELLWNKRNKPTAKNTRNVLAADQRKEKQHSIWMKATCHEYQQKNKKSCSPKANKTKTKSPINRNL